ncbi:MAG: hypothetical protein EPN97_15615 [Alphaproteobacteria bacterium]|nr:MAG: hypothetical protein EPN97_15615 [Alphaproteobacteria bacterium]
MATFHAMKTYVEFIRPSKKIPAGEATTAEVESRDVLKLDIPPRCDIFYFYDSPIANPDDAANDQRNCSKFYIVAKKLVTRDEAKKLIAPRMAKSEMARVIWDVKLENNRLFALTRNNNLEVVTRDNIVVDANGQQLWPKPRRKRALTQDFNTALDHDISVKKPVRLKLKPPAP